MFFNLRAAGGALALASIATSSYFVFKKKCSPLRTSYFYKSSLSTNESILDCYGEGRSYSVFLEFQDNSASSSDQNNLSFKVVDNNERKIRWGPGVDSRNKWQDFGIGIEVADKKNVEGTQEAKIRVPKAGNVYKSWNTVQIPCQKNKLKWKPKEDRDCKECCSGGFLKGNKAKFKIDSGNIKIESESFFWKDGFNPKQVFCNY